MDIQNFLAANNWIFLVILIWTIPWKGYALWKAAKTDHKFWFIAILLINSLAILDILFIFVFSKMGKKK